MIVSGDSDFSPLVSKLKENGKHVIGLGMKGSTSDLLRDNCDEFIYYEDLERQEQNEQQLATDLNSYLPPNLPERQREVFSLFVEACHALRRENHEVLYASMIKDTMKRKKPSFDESYYGYRSFTHLLEDADNLALVDIERNPKSGTYVVSRFCGEREAKVTAETTEVSGPCPRPGSRCRPASRRAAPAARRAGAGVDREARAPAAQNRSKIGGKTASGSPPGRTTCPPGGPIPFDRGGAALYDHARTIARPAIAIRNLRRRDHAATFPASGPGARPRGGALRHRNRTPRQGRALRYRSRQARAQARRERAGSRPSRRSTPRPRRCGTSRGN